MIGSDGAEAELDGSMRCIVVMHRLHARECGEVRGQSSNRSGGWWHLLYYGILLCTAPPIFTCYCRIAGPRTPFAPLQLTRMPCP